MADPSTEPVFDDVAAVHRLDDWIEVYGRTPGPAGSANLVLSRGALLRVDYAEPQVLVDWSADATTVPGDDSLVPLFGRDIAEQIVEYTQSGDTAPRRLIGSATTRRPRPGGAPEATPARRAGEFVRLADRADDDRPLLVRAAAALDVAVTRTGADWARAFLPVITDHRALASELVDDCTDELVLRALSDVRIREVLTSPRYRALLPGALLDWLDRDPADRSDVPPGAAVVSATLAAPMQARGIRRRPQLEVLEAAPPTPIVERDGGVWTVRVPGEADAWPPRWVRILDTDHTVLAVSPCVSDGPDGLAELVLPPGTTVDATEVVVTNEPFPVRGSNALAGIARAVRAGRDAVDLETAGNARRAHQGWLECARRWEALGDHERRDAAQRCADTTSLRTRDLQALGPPKLVDLIVSIR